MATMTALEFKTAEGAEQMQGLLQDLQRQQLITILDAAIVTWPASAKKPQTHQLHDLASAGALNGAFWGFLFGLIFFLPFLGMAIGAGIGAWTGSMKDIGIDDRFIAQVRETVTPGTSALFLLTTGAVPDRVADAVKQQGLEFELIASNLSKEQEDKLKEVFAAA